MQSTIDVDKEILERNTAPPFVEELQPSNVAEEIEKVPLVEEMLVQT
jgi:hypothetical protein